MQLTYGDILIYFMCYYGLVMSFYSLITLFQNRNDMEDNFTLDYFPMVSILIPAYNEEKTLSKTIESLLKLDYPKKNFEVLIIDDGSTDDTAKIGKAYAKKYANIVYIHQKNSGKGAALNHGLRVCKGEFAGALDADSFVEPDALKAILSRFDDPKTMAVTPSMKVYEPKGVLQKMVNVEYCFGIYLRKVFSFIASIHVTPGPFSIFRKSFFDEYGNYDEKNITEDIEIALRIQSLGFHIDNALSSYVYTVSPNKFSVLMNQRLRWYKGFCLNVSRYSSLFSPQYGNLGLVYLPAALLTVFLSILAFFYTFFKMGESTWNHIDSFMTLGMNSIHLYSFNFDMFFLNIDSVAVLSLFTLIVSLVIIGYAYKMSKKPKDFFFHYLYFVLFYWFFYALWWTLTLYCYVSGKKLKWGNKTF